ncbi:alpha/beta fold hydrolase [Rhizobium sp. A37_96]
MHATVNGTELYFDMERSALTTGIDGHLSELPTIIALHGGLGFDHGYLRDGVGKLADIAQVVYVDLRGQGRSARPPLETATLEQMADDVAVLSAQLRLRKPFVLGHSAGGFVALQMALRYPTRLGGLILSGSSPTVAPIQDEPGMSAPSLAARASPEALEAAGRVFSGEITAETIEAFFRLVGPYYAAPANMDLVRRLLAATKPDVKMMRHFMTVIASGYDLREALTNIAVPALILVGAHDWVCPPRASRAMNRLIANSKLVEFEHSGHFVFSEEPRKFHDVVAQFLHSHLNAIEKS